jgi:GT2 family glycosyltransferase
MIATAATWAARRTASGEGVTLGLSAAICTRNRPEQLARAIQSLLKQVQPLAEIIVVDNAPQNDATRTAVQRFPAVRYLQEEKAGLDFARNRALHAATQKVVAFLDDDAVADAHWSEMLLARFEQDERMGACTGRVEALSLEHEGQQIVERNGGYARGLQPVILPRDASRALHGLRAPLIAWTISIGGGCSLAVRREFALTLGGFDVALGGRKLPGGDDHDMLWRLLTSGYGVCYEPRAVAWHEHRRDAKAAYEQIVLHQRGLLAFLAKATMFGSVSQRAGVIAFLVWRLIKPAVRIVRRATGRDPLPARVLFQVWWNCWRGLVGYPLERIALKRAG